MIESTPYFWVVCDGCRSSASYYHDFSAWETESQAVEAAMDDSGWWSPDPGNAHYCPPCARIRQPDTGVTT